MNTSRGKRGKKKVTPRNHPSPWGSALWDHLEEIKALRGQRKKWQEITDHLVGQYGIKITHRAVRNFFVRSLDPNRRIPAGFEGTAIAGASPRPAQRAAGKVHDLTEPDFLSTIAPAQQPRQFKIIQPNS